MHLMTHVKQRIQYPKLILLAISIVLSYVLFREHFFSQIAVALNSHGYVAIAFAGFLFSYGFTAPLAVGFFVELAPQVNIFVAAIIAGFSALLSDILIFHFIRTSFQDEFDRLKLTFIFKKLHQLINYHLGEQIKKYLLFTAAGFLIASPLPDELGVSLLSGFTSIDKRAFVTISFFLNTLGIWVILAFAHFSEVVV